MAYIGFLALSFFLSPLGAADECIFSGAGVVDGVPFVEHLAAAASSVLPENVRKLVIKQSSLTVLRENLLAGFCNLKTLVLEDNRLLTKIVGDFSRVFLVAPMRVVIIGSPKLSFVDKNFTKTLLALRALVIRNTALADVSFVGQMERLVFCDLSRNAITDAPDIRGLSKLLYYNLIGNSIGELSETTIPCRTPENSVRKAALLFGANPIMRVHGSFWENIHKSCLVLDLTNTPLEVHAPTRIFITKEVERLVLGDLTIDNGPGRFRLVDLTYPDPEVSIHLLESWYTPFEAALRDVVSSGTELTFPHAIDDFLHERANPLAFSTGVADVGMFLYKYKGVFVFAGALIGGGIGAAHAYSSSAEFRSKIGTVAKECFNKIIDEQGLPEWLSEGFADKIRELIDEKKNALSQEKLLEEISGVLVDQLSCYIVGKTLKGAALGALIGYLFGIYIDGDSFCCKRDGVSYMTSNIRDQYVVAARFVGLYGALISAAYILRAQIACARAPEAEAFLASDFPSIARYEYEGKTLNAPQVSQGTFCRLAHGLFIMSPESFMRRYIGAGILPDADISIETWKFYASLIGVSEECTEVLAQTLRVLFLRGRKNIDFFPLGGEERALFLESMRDDVKLREQLARALTVLQPHVAKKGYAIMYLFLSVLKKTIEAQ